MSMRNCATEWLKTSPVRVDDRMFHASQEMEFDRSRKNLAKPRKKTVIETKGESTDGEISKLGVHREPGYCFVTGDFLEIYYTTSFFITGKGKTAGSEPNEKDEEETKKTKTRSVFRSVARAEKTIRRLVNENRLKYMWTLTLAPPSKTNDKRWVTLASDAQRDIVLVKSLWMDFYRRMPPGEWKWLVVFELHDSKKTSEKKSGTWHVHFCTDSRIEWATVVRLWPYGIGRFDDFSRPKKGKRDTEVRNPGAYMSKYIGKNFTEANKHVKRYSRSRNMKIPEKISLETYLERYGDREKKVVFENSVEHEREGLLYKNYSVTLRIKGETSWKKQQKN